MRAKSRTKPKSGSPIGRPEYILSIPCFANLLMVVCEQSILSARLCALKCSSAMYCWMNSPRVFVITFILSITGSKNDSIPTNLFITITKLTKSKTFNILSAITNNRRYKQMDRDSTILVPMRATPAERDVIKALAKRTGLFFADWMRQAADCQIRNDDEIFFAESVSKNDQTGITADEEN
jgi:hypothetical protein